MRHIVLPVGTACFFAVSGVSAVWGQASRDPAVTSDTPAYCGELMNRLSGMARGAAIPREAVVLSAEGERMCEHGQTRGGIMRLRRALAIMRHPAE